MRPLTPPAVFCQRVEQPVTKTYRSDINSASCQMQMLSDEGSWTQDSISVWETGTRRSTVGQTATL